MSLNAVMQWVGVTRSVWVLVPFLGVLTLVAPASAATTISGTVWLDLDGDGIQDGGAEVGQSGVEVAIYAVGETDPTATDSTDGSGDYSLGVPEGSYYVQFTAPGGYEFSAMNQGADDNVDSDVDPDGESNIFTVDGTAGDDIANLDAGLIEPTSVSGFVWDDLDGDGIQDAGETGISGVGIQLRDADSGDALVASTATGGDGLYEISNLVPLANGFLQIVLPADHALSAQDAGSDDTVDSDFDPATDKTANFAISYSDEIEHMDGGLYEGVTVSGQVWDDEDGDGVLDDDEGGLSANATVKLYDAGADEAIGGGDDTEADTADTQTTYSFTDVAPGTYYVEVTAPAGWDFVRQDQGGDDAADSDVDEDSGQTPVFTVESGDDDVVRDAGLAQFGSVSGLVWKDADNDGVQDGGETGQEDVSVGLYLADDDEFVQGTTTESDGTYQIAKVIADDCYVRFSVPTGYTFSAQDQGGDDAADSDADPDSGKTADFTVAASTDVENVDAGLQVDTDGDGTADHEDDCPDNPEKTSEGDCGCDELDTDTDEDGIANCNDNCPSVANADQADDDDDGIGDVCEIEDETPADAPDDDATTDDQEDDGEDQEEDGDEEETDETTDDGPPFLRRLFCGPFGLFQFAFTLVGYGTFVTWWRRRR
ncbi:MAG: hypothetical protein KKI02_09595 [Planctomycetes bacterium]|nr:hypothetical protein [Planctomycetota bacterium]